MVSRRFPSLRIINDKYSSRCKDGSLVKEYTLNTPVCDQDITTFRHHGEVQIKVLGGNQLFTFSSGILTLKGMIDDTLIYGTYKKEDEDAVNLLMNLFFENPIT